MAARPLFWIAGTPTAAGRRFTDSRGTTFQHLEIREQGGGNVRRVTTVHAVDEVAALIEKNTVGTFFFWALPGERRLWCIARADGPKGRTVLEAGGGKAEHRRPPGAGQRRLPARLPERDRPARREAVGKLEDAQ